MRGGGFPFGVPFGFLSSLVRGGPNLRGGGCFGFFFRPLQTCPPKKPMAPSSPAQALKPSPGAASRSKSWTRVRGAWEKIRRGGFGGIRDVLKGFDSKELRCANMADSPKVGGVSLASLEANPRRAASKRRGPGLTYTGRHKGRGATPDG